MRSGGSDPSASSVHSPARGGAIEPASTATRELRPGPADSVLVDAPSFAGGGSSVASPAVNPTASASVSGRVLDALGGPIAGALVRALHEHSDAPLASTVTAGHGGFELRTAPGPLRVVAQAEGYSTESRRAVAPAGDITLSLAPATSIFGRVSDASDAPVSGAVVRARGLWRQESFDPSVVTDREGRFRFEALSAGEYELSATGDRLSGKPERVAANVADEVGPVELRVASAARVALEVERGGAACTSGWVQLSGERFQAAREIFEGHVLFEGVPRGEYGLSLGCEQAAFQSRELGVGDEDIERKITLDALQALRGRVVNAVGAGVEGVLVTASPTDASEARAQMTCRSGKNGEFLCDGLSAGAYRWHAGLELQPQSGFVEVELAEGAASAPVELRLWPRARMVVSLEHAPSERLSAVRVSARPQQGPPLEGERRGSEFHFDGLLLGSYAVYLAASPGTRRDVVLEHDGQRVDVSLPWPRTRSISGVVLDERDQPVVEVWVHAAAEGGFLPLATLSDVGVPALTDSAGRFSIEGVFEGRYNLRVKATKREGFAEGVASGTEDVVIHVAAPREAIENSKADEMSRATH